MATPKQQAARNERLLKEVARMPDNKLCAICTAKGPQCTCQPPGIFVCSDCGGVIRKFPGFRIKSRSMATYTAEEIRALRADGNEKFKRSYLAKWNSAAFPHPIDRNPKKIENFVKQVLVEKNFYQDVPAQPKEAVAQPPSPAPSGTPPKLQAAPRAARAGSLDPSEISRADSISSAVAPPAVADWNAFDAPQAPSKPPSVASETAPNGVVSASFDPFAASDTAPPPAAAAVGTGSASFEDAFSVTSTSSNVQASAAPSTQQWKPFDEDGGGLGLVGGQDDNSVSAEVPLTSPKPKPKMRELPMDMFSTVVEPTAAIPPQASAFMGGQAAQQMPGAHVQSPLFPQGQTPLQQVPFHRGVPGGQGFPQQNSAFPSQDQMPRMFQHPGQQNLYQQPSQQGTLQQPGQQGMFQPFGRQGAFQAPNQQALYHQQAPQQGMFSQYQGGVPQGQAPNMGFGMGQPGSGFMNGMHSPPTANGMQRQFSMGSPQTGHLGAQSLTSAASLNSSQPEGGDNVLFRNLVEDVRGSLPKGQGLPNPMAGLGAFGNMPQSGYQSGAAGMQQQAYGNSKQGMGQSPLMGQSTLIGASAQGAFSTSGNPFA